MAVIESTVLIDGDAAGPALVLDSPISFWGGVDPRTGSITQALHPQNGVVIGGAILVVPAFIGSSSSSAVMLELLHAGLAPAGIITGARDAILCLGILVADEMNWPTIPVVECEISVFKTGQHTAIHKDGRVVLE
ncbi:MAG: DUF126 domain-containing protein [Pseudomonadota bacterium]